MKKINFLKQDALSQDAIVRALCENYESIYAVDAGTSAYQCFHESNSYNSLGLDDHGDDFFREIDSNIAKTIYQEDREFVRVKMSREALSAALDKDKYYSFVYRLMIGGESLYHKLRVTKDIIHGRPYYLIGIRNVDAAFRQDRALVEKLSSMHSKELNHLEAILASAEGYLEANLSNDTILDFSFYKDLGVLPAEFREAAKEGTLAYSTFMQWHIVHMVEGNRNKCAKISDRAYLIRCIEKGEKRASVSFSAKTASGKTNHGKTVFYLYQDVVSGDYFAFCVLYDLTEQQAKEKELRDLENKLQMSRIRNSTSQMQPHFLYNALGSIQEIMLEDPEYASELLGDFTVHLRSCIRAMENDAPIPFAQELDNIKAYANIEKMRFGEKLKVLYDIQVNDFLILPLSVQPIVENAIRHGIYERGGAGGTVMVRTCRRSGSVVITVEDDGVGFDVEAYRTLIAEGGTDSTGLKNIMFRLDKVMGAQVSVESTVGVGTKVTITIEKERAELCVRS